MDTVALWVASLPGAVGHVAAFGVGTLIAFTAGLLVLCLLRTPLRWTGAAIVVLACLLAARTPQPDVMVSPSGEAFAVRAPDGRLQVIKLGNDAFAIREWLAADGDVRGDVRTVAETIKARQGFACDDAGCVAKVAGGGVVAIGTAPAAFGDDCARAVLVVTTRTAPPGCAAQVIDRTAWRQGGALALRRIGTAWTVTEAQPRAQDRPWAPIASQRGARAGAPKPITSDPRDAIPHEDDLRADD
jgi:competence protein ComEC